MRSTFQITCSENILRIPLLWAQCQYIFLKLLQLWHRTTVEVHSCYTAINFSVLLKDSMTVKDTPATWSLVLNMLCLICMMYSQQCRFPQMSGPSYYLCHTYLYLLDRYTMLCPLQVAQWMTAFGERHQDISKCFKTMFSFLYWLY